MYTFITPHGQKDRQKDRHVNVGGVHMKDLSLITLTYL